MGNSGENEGWPPGPTIVALGLLTLIGAITITAIVRYSSVEDALKFYSALSALVGVVTGAFVAYFFTRSTVQAATKTVRAATDNAQALQGVAATAQGQTEAAQRKAQETQDAFSAAMSVVTDEDVLQKIRDEPAVQRLLN